MLRNTVYRLNSKMPLTIAYFGGSITEGAGASDAAKTSWRGLTTRYFREKYPESEITEIQAAIGGTGSDLGIYRCDRDVTSHNPDLVFIEFAVNDSGWGFKPVFEHIEAIVRKIWTANPYADVVMTYTVTKSISDDMAVGGEFRSRSADYAVAHLYGISSVDMGEALRQRILTEGGDWLKYTTDTVHPNDAGYAICADVVAKFLDRELDGECSAPCAKTLPTPFSPVIFEGGRNFERASMKDIRECGARFSGFDIKEESMCGRYPRYAEALEPGASFEFDFTGSDCGFYWMLAKDGGDVTISVDGGEWNTYHAWDFYCLGFDRAALLMFARGLECGAHTVRAKVAETNHGDERGHSVGHAIRISAVMVS